MICKSIAPPAKVWAAASIRTPIFHWNTLPRPPWFSRGRDCSARFRWHGETCYRIAYTLQSALLAAAGTPSVLNLSRRIGIPDRVALWRYSAMLLVLFSFVVWRFDIFPTLATILALMCLVGDRSLAAGLWLGVAIATKLYAVVLLPIFVGYELCRGRIAAAARVGFASLVPGALSLMPWIVHHSTAFLSFAISPATRHPGGESPRRVHHAGHSTQMDHRVVRPGVSRTGHLFAMERILSEMAAVHHGDIASGNARPGLALDAARSQNREGCERVHDGGVSDGAFAYLHGDQQSVFTTVSCVDRAVRGAAAAPALVGNIADQLHDHGDFISRVIRACRRFISTPCCSSIYGTP